MRSMVEGDAPLGDSQRPIEADFPAATSASHSTILRVVPLSQPGEDEAGGAF